MNPPAFVLDCSLTLAWFFADEKSDYADGVLTALATTAGAVVPGHWRLEVANGLISGERRNRATEDQSAAFLARLTDLPIVADPETETRAWSDTIALARRHKLTEYDATYLELALRRGLPIATLDKPLLAAARAAGVARFEP